MMPTQFHHSSVYHPKRSLSETSTTSTSSHHKSDSHKSTHGLSSKLLLKRSKSPAPIDIPSGSHSRQASTSPSQPRDIPRSAPNHSYFTDDHHCTSPQMSPNKSSPRSPKSEFAAKRVGTPTRKNSDDYRRFSGTVNQVGRHSNDWLFGGISVRDTVRDSFEKLRHQDQDKES